MGGGTEKTLLPAEQRRCCRCTLSEPETQLPSLTKCEKYKHLREAHFLIFKINEIKSCSQTTA